MADEFKGVRLFLNIPVDVAHDKRIKSDKSKLLFGEIYSMLNVTGSFYMSNKEIAKRINARSIKTVQNCLDELENLGYIKREVTRDPSNNQVTERRITSDWRPGVTHYTRVGKSVAGGSGNQLQEGSVTDYTQIEHSNKTSNRTFKKNNSQAQPDTLAQQRREVIEYLNKKTDSKFKPNAKGNKSVIDPRLKEGYTVDDMKMIIDAMYSKWHGNKFSNGSMGDDYLRPETLFRVSKIEGYLNVARKMKKQQKPDDLFDMGGWIRE